MREERSGYKVLMSLLIKGFSEQDVGSYKCVSTNSLGKADGTLRLYGKFPDPVEEVYTIYNSNKYFLLVCVSMYIYICNYLNDIIFFSFLNRLWLFLYI